MSTGWSRAGGPGAQPPWSTHPPHPVGVSCSLAQRFPLFTRYGPGHAVVQTTRRWDDANVCAAGEKPNSITMCARQDKPNMRRLHKDGQAGYGHDVGWTHSPTRGTGNARPLSGSLVHISESGVRACGAALQGQRQRRGNSILNLFTLSGDAMILRRSGAPHC